MDPLDRITKMLSDETPRKRIAAAVVLGELKVKDPRVVAGLIQMAQDPVDAYAEAAIEALGNLRAFRALPVLLDSITRGREIEAKARAAIAALGEEAVPAIRSRLAQAAPEAKVALSALLPSLHGKQSFDLTLEGLFGQSWEAINTVALLVRHEVRSLSESEKQTMKAQAQKLLSRKKTADDELALRGIIKILGFLELADAQDVLLEFLAPKWAPAVRVEATTALRFALGKGPSKKALRRLMVLLLDDDVTVGRAARESLTVLKIGVEFADELAELCLSEIGEVSLWAMAHLGELLTVRGGTVGALAAKTLFPVAQGADRTRAQAAAKVLAQIPGGERLLAQALAFAQDETGAQVLADALAPLAAALPTKAMKQLLDAGTKNLGKHLSIARKQLEPVRVADPQAWAEVLRAKAHALVKKDPARAEAISQLLGRSRVATGEDRFSLALQHLAHSSLDPHPLARQRDPALAELEKLHQEGFKLGEALTKSKQLTDEARYYVGVHFAEKAPFEFKNLGAQVLENVAHGKGKMAKAAKNKMKLLQLS